MNPCTSFHPRRLHRRSFVQIGSLLPLGIGLGCLRETRGATSAHRVVKKVKSCVLLWLDGGPSHLEMWDPKIDAPAEVRGPFGSISTAIPGVHFSECLARSAKLADRMTILRSLTSPLGEHGLANQYLLTGYPPSPALQYPSMGSVVAHHRGSVDRAFEANGLPPYIGMPEARTSMGAGFLGAEAEPFFVGSDPASPQFRVRDLEFSPGVDWNRFDRRRRMLAQLEAWRAEGQLEVGSEKGTAFEAAFRMVDGAETREAFDLSGEPDSVRARYGPRSFGQGCLLARRLVEREVPFITVVQSGWDTHENLKLSLRDGFAGANVGVGLIPTFDAGVASLIEDLEARGLLEETLVIAMGEFGRTPKLNPRGGRDHWPRVFSAMLCGGGIPRGLVLGASDRTGESPHERPITPADLVRTLYHHLGIESKETLRTPDGRTIAIYPNGRDIHELL